MPAPQMKFSNGNPVFDEIFAGWKGDEFDGGMRVHRPSSIDSLYRATIEPVTEPER